MKTPGSAGQKGSALHSLKETSFYLLVGGLLVSYLPFSILESFRSLGMTAAQIGIVGLFVLEFLPSAWRSGLITRFTKKILSVLWGSIIFFFRQIRQLVNKKSRTTPSVSVELTKQAQQLRTSFFMKKTGRSIKPLIDEQAEKIANQYPMLEYLPSNQKKTLPEVLKSDELAITIKEALELSQLLPKKPQSPITIDVRNIQTGPSLQTITFRLPVGLQVSQLMRKKDDMANHMGYREGFDIQPGNEKSSAAIVIPRKKRDKVFARDILLQREFQKFATTASLPLSFGVNAAGEVVLYDLTKAPHLLVCGATGSGKSVFLNLILVTLLSVKSPDELQLLLIDPKMVELNIYNGFPHLLGPIVTDVKRAGVALNKVVMEMERRYSMFTKTDTRNIESYNRKSKEQLPFIVVVVDEYADLMMVAQQETEDSIQRITQKARAAGIHLVLGTQRPSVDVVTGIIKSNIPSRIAFKMLSQIDYRTVLDTQSPDLLGNGDGVMLMNGATLTRFQSAAVSTVEEEVNEMIRQLKGYWLEKDGTTHRSVSSFFEGDDSEQEPIQPSEEKENNDEDELYRKAVELVINQQTASASFLQRHLRVGYTRAAKLIEQMEMETIVSKYNGEGARKVLCQSLEQAFEKKSYSVNQQPPWAEPFQINMDIFESEKLKEPDDSDGQEPNDTGTEEEDEIERNMEWISRKLKRPKEDLLVRVAAVIKKRGVVQARVIVEEIPQISLQKAERFIRELDELGMFVDADFGKRVRWIDEFRDIPSKPRLRNY